MADTVTIDEIQTDASGAVHVLYSDDTGSGHGLRFTGGWEGVAAFCASRGAADPVHELLREMLRTAVAKGAKRASDLDTLINKRMTRDYTADAPTRIETRQSR